MELDTWRIFASLGVPGVALGVLYMLFRQFKWQFPSVPRAWVGPIVVLFIVVTGGVVYSALVLWAPGNTPAPDVDATLPQVDVTGDWVADIVDDGDQFHWSFTFDVIGDELYGSAYTWPVYAPQIHEGRIIGNDIIFKTVWRNRFSTDPSQIRDVWMTFRGKVGVTRIDFTMQDDDGHAPFRFFATRVIRR